MAVTFRRYPSVVTGPLGERIIKFFEQYYPKSTELYVTSGMDGDHGAVSHHYGLEYNGSPTAAIDFGSYDDASEAHDKNQEDMGFAADWIYKYFWDLTVELIHTQPHNNHETYVKNQVKVRPYATDAHVSHIHWATSRELMTLIEARGREMWGDGPAPAEDGGGQIGTGSASDFDLPPGHYYGLVSGPAESHGGYYAVEKPRVRLIQQRLQALKFAPSAEGWADGLFEEPTEQAVKAFQARADLPVNGRVDRQTWDKLFDPNAPTGGMILVGNVIFGCDIYDGTVENFGLTEGHVRGFVQNGGLSLINAKFWEQESDGSVYPHRQAARMLRAAVDAGVTFPSGFVCPRSGVNPDKLVENLINFADQEFPAWRTHPDFYWQVDLERWPYDAVDVSLGVETAKQLMKVSQTPAILYASRGQYNGQIPNYPGRKLWNANYNGSGASRDYRQMYLGDNAPGWADYSGATPVINQFCSDGKVNGFGPLVMSAFRGNADHFRRMLQEAIAPYQTAPQPAPPSGSRMREPVSVLARGGSGNGHRERILIGAGKFGR